MASHCINQSALRILRILHQFKTHRFGLTMKQLVDKVENATRRTLYNDIETLKAAGYDFERSTVYFEGEEPVVRLRLVHSPVRSNQ